MLDFRFQDKIEVSRSISVIKDLTSLDRNSSKASIRMICWISINFFSINTRSGKNFRPLSVRWEFPSPDWVKINTDGTVRGILVLLLVEVFLMGV